MYDTQFRIAPSGSPPRLALGSVRSPHLHLTSHFDLTCLVYSSLAMPLSSLPTELIESIARYLDLSSFCSLRLTTLLLKQQSLHVFRERFFRRQSVSWTKHDLDRLVEMSNHADFGSSLQHLSVDATPWHSMSLWQLRKRISEADAIISESDGLFFKSELQEKYIEEEKAAKELAAFFNETRYDHKCLRAVFGKVQNLESIVFKYRGMERKYGKFGRRYCESSQHEMSRPFVSTMAAVAASGVHVKTIAVHPVHHHGAVSIGRLECLSPSLRNFDAVFGNLKTLELNLRDWRYPDEGFELESLRAPFVMRFLAKARNVKDITIGCYSSLQDDLIGEMARYCTFGKLESCKLSHFGLHNASDLAQLLGPSFTTLRRLSLSHMRLMDEAVSWADLVRNLASSEDTFQALRRMHLEKLFTKSGSRLSLNGGMGQEKLSLVSKDDGPTWRDDAVRAVDLFSEGTWGPAYQLGAVAYPFIDMRT